MDYFIQSIYSFFEDPTMSFDTNEEMPRVWDNISFEGDAGVRAKQNNEAEQYTFTNYFNNKNPINAATSQVGMVPTGYQFDIDENNKLEREGSIRLLRTGCKIETKPYITCPDISRGIGSIDAENFLVYDSKAREQRCDIQSTETYIQQYTLTPLIPSVQKLVGKNALLYNYDITGIDTRRNN